MLLKEFLQKLQQNYINFNNNLNFPNEVRILICNILNISQEKYLINFNNIIIGQTQKKIILSHIQRRIQGEPIAYIIQQKYFWKSPFFVDNRVLIPRADTETIIEATLKHFPNKDRNLKILDIGIGSGCILLSLLQEYPNSYGKGIDISLDACDVSNINIKNLQLEKRVEVQHIAITHFPQKEDTSSQRYNLIVSNPPYIAYDDTEVQENVQKFEPKESLFAENNGLSIYQQIFFKAKEILEQNSFIILEIGHTQAIAVIQLAENTGYNYVKTYKDISGKSRVLVFNNY